MARDGDILELGGRRVYATRDSHAHITSKPSDARSRFLSVWFRCCHVYGRMQQNAERTAYDGRCPRCGAAVHADIGPGGTSQRTFEAF